VLTSAASDWTFARATQVVLPALSVSDVTIDEGDAGTTNLVFDVTRTGDLSVASSVDFTTTNGSASAPEDFQAASGTLIFAAGESVKTIAVSVNGDTAIEADESMNVVLSNPIGATIADGQAQGTIENDDLAPPDPGTDVRVWGIGSLTSHIPNAFVIRAGVTRKGDAVGHVSYQSLGKLPFISTQLNAVTCGGNGAAVIEGVGRVGRHRVGFRVDVRDGGRRGHNDRFSISWWGPTAGSATGLLKRGDIRIEGCNRP